MNSRNQPPVKRWRDLLASERDAAALYSRLAEAEAGERRQIFRELASIELGHAAHWESKLRSAGAEVPAPGRPTLRTRLLGAAADRLSVRTVLPLIERAERADRSGALRAGVFGVSDGLVSNTALVMGFAGSGVSHAATLLAGTAGLLLAFATGAFVVVLPYLAGSGTAALAAAVGLALAAMFAVGATIGALNGRSSVRMGLRQMFVGALAAAVTYGVGHLIGAHVS